MAEFPYTTVVAKLRPLMTKIQEVGVPTKATVKWLESVGYRSKNDRSLLSVLRFIDFVDSMGAPTKRWREYRSKDHSAVLAEAIRHGYSELYAMYPDAHSRPNSDLESFFKTHTSASNSVALRMVNTFKTLSSLASFDGKPTKVSDEKRPRDEGEPPKQDASGSRAGIPIHIDIQVHVSPQLTADQIDQVFKSMATHLSKLRDE